MKTKNPIVIIFYFCLFCALLLGAIFVVKAKYFENSKKQESQSQNKTQPADKVINQPGERQIVITEDQINSEVAKFQQDVINNPTVTITPAKVILTGSAKKLFGLQVAVSGYPIVDNNQIKLKITEAKTGIISVPAGLVEKATAQINDYLNKNVTQGLVVKSVLLNNKEIIIKGY